MNKTSPVTRKDVARIAGISLSAVSLVLNKTPCVKISDATRKRIIEDAEQLGYRQSSFARAIVSGKTNVIGISTYYMKSPFNFYISQILSGAWQLLTDNGYRLIFNILKPDDDIANLLKKKLQTELW